MVAIDHKQKYSQKYMPSVAQPGTHAHRYSNTGIAPEYRIAQHIDTAQRHSIDWSAIYCV